MINDYFSSVPGGLVLTLHGSRLFGVHNPDSDLDVKAITKPAINDLLLGRKNTLTPIETKLGDLELTTHPIQSFLSMLKRADTNAIDMLFAASSAHGLMAATPEGEALLELLAPEKLVTRNLSGALGYARAQATKYSRKGDRLNTLNALIEVFERQPLGARTGEVLEVQSEADLTAFITKNLPANSNDDVRYEEQKNKDSNTQRFIRATGKSLDLNAKISFNLHILKNTANGYGARAKAAANAAGTDLKAWYHALRVTNQAVELHTTGNLIFPRPNADLLDAELAEDALDLAEALLAEAVLALAESQDALVYLPLDTDESEVARYESSIERAEREVQRITTRVYRAWINYVRRHHDMLEAADAGWIAQGW